MSRRYISQYGEGENIDEIYVASEKQLRANRNGNLYLQVRLSDKTGSMTGMLWNANDRLYDMFENGDYLRATGTTQHYNGNLQAILNRVEPVDASRVDETDFVTIGRQQLDAMTSRVSEILRSVSNVHLRNLADCYLMDDAFMQDFRGAPAGIKNHHAYRGGLLEHVLSLLELCDIVAPRYPDLNRDILILGAFLHDSGKTGELNYERELSYSDEGQLIGHLVIGAEILDQKIKQAEELAGEAFPQSLRLALKHIILSHHGEYEYGSPKLPMTLEAVALHYLDSLDARMHNISELIKSDANSDSNWTTYQPALGRKFCKGLGDAS